MMGSGGLEKWLLDLIASMDSSRYHSDILVQSSRLGLHGLRAQQLGIEVIAIADGHRPLHFARDFIATLKHRGPYDVVHCHLHTFSGFVLTLAKLQRVPVRIAHGHNDTSGERHSIPRRFYRLASRRLIARSATHGFGVSEAVARDLFGNSYPTDSRWHVLPCGIQLDPFREPIDRASVRNELGLPPDGFVIAQVGRLTPMKNQAFTLDLLAHLNLPHAQLLLVGDGEMESQYRSRADALRISNRVFFAGPRADVPRILCGAADVFVFPSRPGEGAPIALIEAQAAGLPCLVSDNISASSVVIPDLVQQLRIDQGTSSWIDAINRLQRMRPCVSRSAASALVARSPFSIDANCQVLSRLYVEAA
jgi:glycosyltransferase involved in cell wall biosynthesis